MSLMSPLAGKVIIVALFVIAGGLLIACPSRGQCPLVQLMGGGWRPTDAARPEPAQTESGVAAAQLNAAINQPDPDIPPQEGDSMLSPEPKTQPRGEVLHAGLEDFEQVVLESESPVLVDFYADWCRPCQILAPTLDELAREMPEARIVKVNVDQNPELAGQFGVSSIPTLMVFKDGNLVAKRMGVLDKASLKELLRS